MASQTGSIDLTASNGVKLMAEAGFENIEGNYATKAELDVQADRIGMVVANNDASSSLQLTADAMTYIGNNVTIKGTDGTSTVISGGQIQANSLSIGAFDSAAQSATLNSNISVGGRNWLLDTGTFNDWFSNTGITFSNGVATFPSRSSLWWMSIRHITIPAADFFGNTWTFSFDYRSDDFSDTSGQRFITVNVEGGTTSNASARTKYRALNNSSGTGAADTWVPTTEWQRGSVTFTATDESYLSGGSGDVNYVGITIWSYTLNSFQVRRMKLERGNKATDWSPAPEDVDSAISDAAKTATSYVTDITGGGVMVHPSDDATSGVQITSDVDIMRDGTSVINIGTNDAVRIGAADNVQMLLASDGMEIDNEAGNTIFAVESNSTGTTTVTVVAEVVTWAAETDVVTTTYIVSDASAASGYAVVSATIADTDYTLVSTYATATVTAGTGVSVALTSDGVDYVRSLMSDAEVTAGTLSVEYQRAVADSASLTLDGSQVVNGSGRAIALLNDVSGTETFFDAYNTDTNARVLFGVGAGGYNRGIWDTLASSWIIYRNSHGETIIGGPNFSVSSSGAIKTRGGGHSNLSGRLTVGNRVTATDTGGQVSLVSTTTGNKGVWDETEQKWLVWRNTDGELVLGTAGSSDPLYRHESTCTVNTTNATIYDNHNMCWHNNAVCTVMLAVNLKAALANGSTVQVATAPAGYRPPDLVLGNVYSTVAAAQAQAVIGTGGGITLNNRSGSAISTSANIYISFTFAL